MPVILVILTAALCLSLGLLISLFCVHHEQGAQLRQLQADNRKLVEAASRSGSPVYFEPPPKHPVNAWFDTKPTVVVKRDSDAHLGAVEA